MKTYTINGRPVVIDCRDKPIPLDSFDCIATFDDYDGAPDAHPRYQLQGHGSTPQEAVASLCDDMELHDIEIHDVKACEAD